MVKYYCDRCGAEIKLTSKDFNPYVSMSAIIPNVSFQMLDSDATGPFEVNKKMQLCHTCFENVLAYTVKSK